MSARPVPPMTMRMTPIDSGVVPSGPSACDVPVVPNSSAAARTARTCTLQFYRFAIIGPIAREAAGRLVR